MVTEQSDSEPVIVIDEGDLRKYRIELPNLVDDSDLTPREIRLYIHYKRACSGRYGCCFESNQTLAKTIPGMSLGSINAAKKGLLKKKWVKLGTIKIDGKDHPAVFMIDKWPENFKKYAADAEQLLFMNNYCSGNPEQLLFHNNKHIGEELEDTKQSSNSSRRGAGKPAGSGQAKPVLLTTAFCFDAETTTWLDGEWREGYSQEWQGLTREDWDKAVEARRQIFINHWTNTTTKRINWNQQFRLDFTRNGYYEFEAILKRLGYYKQKANGKGHGKPNASDQLREARRAH
jgi:hypothetical protein